MKKKIIIIAVVVIVVGVIVVVNLTSGKKGIGVQTETVFRDDITQTVTGNGKIYPVIEVNISANVPGEILQIGAEEGDSVRTGQLLVVLDSQQYQAMRDRQKSNILGARAGVTLADNALQRAKDLYAKNLASAFELENAEAEYDQAVSQLQQAEASLKEAEDMLSKTELKAPMDGLVIKKNKEVGEIALGSQLQADVILVIANLTSMEARVEVNENDIVNVSLGDSALVEIDAFPDSSFRGVVTEIAHSAITKGVGTVEEVTNYEVKVLLVDKLPSFRPGMSATADIETETRHDVLNIPIQSLTARERKALEEKPEGGNEETDPAAAPRKKERKEKEDELVEVVFVVENDVARIRQVRIGISDDNYYEVLEGLEEGEEVVTGPFKTLSRTLHDGDRIKLEKKEEKPAEAEE